MDAPSPQSSSEPLTPRNTEAELRRLLAQDHATSTLVAVKQGKISRTHYAKMLGCTPGNLNRFKGVFGEYEKDADIVTGPLRHLPAMREWMAAEYEACRLDLRDGKLDRVRFQQHFKLRGGTFLTRHQPIRDLLEDFDARAATEGYLPFARRQELDRVTALLREGPALNKDRLTVNRKLLAEAAGVPLTRFEDPRFADPIRLVDAQVRTRAENSRIDPLVHGRVFPFSGLVGAWSETFAERVGIRFKQMAPTWSADTTKAGHLQLVDALRWIGGNAVPACRAVVEEATRMGRVVSAGDWEDALHSYRSQLVDRIATGDATDSWVDSAISTLRIVLEALVTAQLVPTTAIPLPGVKFARRRSGHLRSVAEDGTVKNVDDYVAFARATLREAGRSFGVDVELGDEETFIGSISSQLGGTSIPDDMPSTIRSILDRRLSAIREHAGKIVHEAEAALRKGMKLLKLADLDTDAFDASYRDRDLGDHPRRLLVQACFPDTAPGREAEHERGKANLLKLIKEKHAGVPPTGNYASAGYGQFFAKRYRNYGGMSEIEALLMPTADVVGAVLTLYLCESGSNAGVGRSLDRDCVEPSDLDGHRRITGVKARAKGKPIIIDLPETSQAVRGLAMLREAGGHLVPLAGEDGRQMFLMRVGGRVQLMTPHWFTSWFKNFASRTPGLDGSVLTPNTLRPSVLLHAALSNDGRLGAGLALAQHGVAVSQGYQQKAPTRLLYDSNIRRFQLAFETLVLSGINDAAERLGISSEEFETRLSALKPTGLGTFCRDPAGRSGDSGSSCATLDCWNDCPHLLIVADVEAVAQLRLWQASLRAAMPDWERDRPERWEAIWLPWLCLTDVVQEKMAREPSLVGIWKKAGVRAAEIAASPGYVPPKPW